jgi:hypothetical protein
MMNCQPSSAEIAKRAYELYLERGRRPGGEADDWLQAERELMAGKQSATAVAVPAPASVPLTAVATVPAKSARPRTSTIKTLGLRKARG